MKDTQEEDGYDFRLMYHKRLDEMLASGSPLRSAGGKRDSLPIGTVLHTPESRPTGATLTTEESSVDASEEWTITVKQFLAVVLISALSGAGLLAFIQEALK